jgi:hypothetical protein
MSLICTKESNAITIPFLFDKNDPQTFAGKLPSSSTDVRTCICDAILFFLPCPFFLKFIPRNLTCALIKFSLLSSDLLATLSSLSPFVCSTCTALRGVHGSPTFAGKDPDMGVKPGSTINSPWSNSGPVLLLKASTEGTGLGVLIVAEWNCF